MRDRFITVDSPRPEPLEFVKTRGNAYADDYEDDYGLWRCPVEVMAEGPIWLYIRTTELPSDCRGPHKHRWESSLIGVSPFFAKNTTIAAALHSVGDYAEDLWDDLDDAKKELLLEETLIDYGTYVPLIEKTSTRAKGPFRGCAQEARAISSLWGFACDRPVNRIGDSGWNFMAGVIGGRAPTNLLSEFDTKVIRWLNTMLPDRSAFHRQEGT